MSLRILFIEITNPLNVFLIITNYDNSNGISSQKHLIQKCVKTFNLKMYLLFISMKTF